MTTALNNRDEIYLSFFVSSRLCKTGWCFLVMENRMILAFCRGLKDLCPLLQEVALSGTDVRRSS
uniref:Uncharacterized protein n=1 Tax=Aegilops tauschii subsp. strangulata TaxID=200361 RepID=A0A453H080_AEGTS